MTKLPRDHVAELEVHLNARAVVAPLADEKVIVAELLGERFRIVHKSRRGVRVIVLARDGVAPWNVLSCTVVTVTVPRPNLERVIVEPTFHLAPANSSRIADHRPEYGMVASA